MFCISHALCSISTGTSSHKSVIDPQQSASAAILNYRAYLKSVYKNSPILPDSKWPPTPSREYINLAVTYNQSCREEYIGYTLQGDVKQILQKRKKITEEDILSEEDQQKLRFVLIEGAPGTGKSTLAWELCRKWDEFSSMKRYSLVVLLRLREAEVQRITNISELFCSYEGTEKENLVHDVLTNHGNGILFILDGFDELPKQLQQKSFLLNLIKGTVLPECTVVVTSRPSATAVLLESCRPRVQKRIEILGFTQESVEAYATSVFKSEPEKLERFKAYISASHNPAINSLMYIPLNAAIVVEVYCNSESDSLLPHTLTELYTQLCLTLLNRHLQSNQLPVVNDFYRLPDDLQKMFFQLSELAFTGIENEKVIFRDISPSFVHFGFLDSVSALYGGGGVSYNFLHLTVQEFLAAHYISQLPGGGVEVFEQYIDNERWNTVWRFVAGITQFKGYESKIAVCEDSIVCEDSVEVTHHFVQFFYEAHTVKYLLPASLESKVSTIVFDAVSRVPLDLYALGSCIANTPSILWNLTLSYESLYHSISDDIPHDDTAVYNIIHGLKGSGSNIKCLKFPAGATDLKKYKSFPLENIVELYLCNCTYDVHALLELFPYMHSLKVLDISEVYKKSVGFVSLLQQLCSSSVSVLNIKQCGFDISSSKDTLSALKQLISPISGKLEDLTIDIGEDDDGTLLHTLLAPSSLKTLTIFCYDKLQLLCDCPVEINNNPPKITLNVYIGYRIGYRHSEQCYSALQNVINPLYGIPADLVVKIYYALDLPTTRYGLLESILLGPSSLKCLSLSLCYKCHVLPLASLEQNNSLQKLSLQASLSRASGTLVEVLRHNKILQHLKLSEFSAEDIEVMKDILTALQENTTLHSIELGITDVSEGCSYPDTEVFDEKSERFVSIAEYMISRKVQFFDSRITWRVISNSSYCYL